MRDIVIAICMLALLFIATLQQIRDIKKGGKAVGLSFLIWTMVDIVSVSAQAATGPAPIAMLLPVGQLLSMSTICAIAFKMAPVLGRTDRSQRTAIALCALGFGMWFLLREPMYALAGNVIANFAGALPTWEQAWRRPHTLSIGFWAISGSAASLGLLLATLQVPLHVASIIPQLTGVFVCGSILMVRFVRVPARRSAQEIA